MSKINNMYSWRDINPKEKHLGEIVSSNYISDKELYRKICESDVIFSFWAVYI